MIELIFIPLVIGSIIGLAFVLMILARIWRMPIDKPNLMNRIAQTLANGDKEKAILLLEDDNHPASVLLAFAFNLTLKNQQELRDAYEYGSHEMEKRLTYGTQTLAWLTMTVPLATLAVWATNFIGVPVDISVNLTWVLIGAIIAEIVFWNVTLFYVKLKSSAIIKRSDDHFRFFSGMIMGTESETSTSESSSGMFDDAEDKQGMFDETEDKQGMFDEPEDKQGMFDEPEDKVELSQKVEEISEGVIDKSKQDG